MMSSFNYQFCMYLGFICILGFLCAQYGVLKRLNERYLNDIN